MRGEEDETALYRKDWDRWYNMVETLGTCVTQWTTAVHDHGGRYQILCKTLFNATSMRLIDGAFNDHR